MVNYLEGRLIELNVNGQTEEVDTVTKARVEKVIGYSRDRRFLQIFLKGNRDDIGLIHFYGESPIRKGDEIRAGVIVDDRLKISGIGKALYVQILGDNGRLDYMDDYNPPTSDAEKLGLI